MKWIPVQLIVAGGLAYLFSNDPGEGFEGFYTAFISLALLILGILVVSSSHDMATLVKTYGFLPHHWWWSPLRFHACTALGLAGVIVANLEGGPYYAWTATGLYLMLVGCAYANQRARQALLHSAHSFTSRYQAS